MENFIAYNPTKVHFGRKVVSDLGEVVLPLGKKILLMYGKGSVLKNGSYDDVKQQLELINAEIVEYDGIKSNPLAGDVDEAAKIGIDNRVNSIVAVGGGSVIDSAKITAVAIASEAKAWDIMKYRLNEPRAIPLVSVLTLAATGTEMNPVAVLQNPVTKEKIGYRNNVMFPRHSFLDPSYTLTVPANYTAYGIVDLTAHALEAYFGEGDASLSDRFVEGIIKEAMDYGPELMDNLQDYELRAKIMWAATTALNGLTSYGRISGDWGVHALSHVLSFLYDTPHGAALSIAYPAWLKKMKERIPQRMAGLGKQLFGVRDADACIKGIEDFFKRTGSPVSLQEENISKEHFEEILSLMNKHESSGLVHTLDDSDRKEILELMFEH